MFFNSAMAADLLPQGTQVAAQWDHLYQFLVGLSVFFFILVVGGMLYLAIKYRKANAPKSKYITGNHALEVIWTIVPTVLLLVIFVWGYKVYRNMTQAPGGSYEVRVLARKWSWQFQYPDGRSSLNVLYVPTDKPVKLIMTSQDVIHSFFVPNFRIKQDAVPGMFTTVWFEATIPGKHQVFCTEYCGDGHSLMLARVVALDEQMWLDWNEGKTIDEASLPAIGVGGVALLGAESPTSSGGGALAEKGKALTQSKGCVACHSDDGTPKVGPSYKGLWGAQAELTDGSKVERDENYLRESILQANAKVVKGFAPTMPPYQGMVNEEELGAIIAYIKSLK